MNEKIAVVILNYIQYINIKIGIEELKRRGYVVDIYCPKVDTDDGFKDMFDKTRQFLKDNNYSVYNKVNNKSYKVLLEPYPCMDIHAKYKIRYRYGMLSAKPNKVYIPDNFLMYDGLLCSGIHEAKYLQAYSNTYLVSNMKYVNYKHLNKKNKKKILLYLPTYGEESSIDIICDYLNELRKKYYVITKIHHGTSFLKNELNKINKLKNSVDEFYDCFKDLIDLMARADVVLTDNSGSIFEAMYAKVPVAVYCDDINQNKIGEFDTIQYDLYKDGILPYTNKKRELMVL